MALDWSKCAAVESVPGRVSGAWVFRGTRLPVATIFENLEDRREELPVPCKATPLKKQEHRVGTR